MNKLTFKNIDFYNNMKAAPYNMETALGFIIAHLITPYNKNFDELSKTKIRMYFNLESQWIQIIHENHLLTTKTPDEMWNTCHSSDNILYDWKTPAFYLAKNIKLETKNETKAFVSSVNLTQQPVLIAWEETNPNNVMKAITIGTRINLMNLNFKLTIEDISNVKSYIEQCFAVLLKSHKLNMFINVVDNKSQYFEIVNDSLKTITSNKMIYSKLSHQPAYETYFNFEINNVYHKVKISIYGNIGHQWMIANNSKVIVLDQHIPTWFNEQLANYSLYVEINDLPLNQFGLDFMWQTKDVAELNKSILKECHAFLISLIKPSQLVDTDSSTNVLTTNFDNLEEFEIHKSDQTYNYLADDGKKIIIHLIKSEMPLAKQEWIHVKAIKQNSAEQVYEFEVSYDSKHDFLSLFSEHQVHKTNSQNFVVAYAIAEVICHIDGSLIFQMKHELNKILRNLICDKQ